LDERKFRGSQVEYLHPQPRCRIALGAIEFRLIVEQLAKRLDAPGRAIALAVE
jgi:hypothetical protein